VATCRLKSVPLPSTVTAPVRGASAGICHCQRGAAHPLTEMVRDVPSAPLPGCPESHPCAAAPRPLLPMFCLVAIEACRAGWRAGPHWL
jgi:hypothetical protein